MIVWIVNDKQADPIRAVSVYVVCVCVRVLVCECICGLCVCACACMCVRSFALCMTHPQTFFAKTVPPQRPDDYLSFLCLVFV